MKTVSIDYVWQAILDSERHDDLVALENAGPIETPANRSGPPLPDHAAALNDPPIAIEVVLITPAPQAPPETEQPQLDHTRKDN
jgi:hypothetical protein